MKQLTNGFINLEIKDIEEQDVKKLHDIFKTLVDSQIHRIRNGSVTLHFDNKGKFRQVVANQVLWKD